MLAQCARRVGCCSWHAHALSSMEEKVVVLIKSWGGRTMMLELSVEPSS